MSEPNFRLEADVTVNDEASGAFESIGQSAQDTKDALGGLSGAVSDGSASWTQHEQQVNAVYKQYRFANKEFLVNHELLTTGTRLFTSIGQSAQKLNSIFINQNLLQNRMIDAEDKLNSTHEKSIKALQKYGAQSQKYLDAKKAEEKAQRAVDQVNRESTAQYLTMALALGSVATDGLRAAREVDRLRSIVGSRGGLSGILGLGGSEALTAGIPPIGGIGSSGGILSKIGGIKGAGAIALGVAGAAQTALEASTPENQKSFNDKLFGALGQAATYAGTGALIGSVVPGIGTAIGAGVGAGAGLALGLGSNFQEEFGNLFNGKGFVTNQQAAMQINGDVHIYPQSASQRDIIAAVASASKTGQRVTPPPT